MKPYGVKIEIALDVGAICAGALKSSVGKVGSGRGYSAGNVKARLRRTWKRLACREGRVACQGDEG